MPLVCGLLALVRLWSMSSTARWSSYFVALGAAELGAAIGQHARQADAVLVIKRHHPIIEDLWPIRQRGAHAITKRFGKSRILEDPDLPCRKKPLIPFA